MWLLSYQYSFEKYEILNTNNKLENILDIFIEEYQNKYDYKRINIWYIKNSDNDFNDITRKRNNLFCFNRSLVYINRSKNMNFLLYLPKKKDMRKAQKEKKTVFAIEEINKLKDHIILLQYSYYFYQWHTLYEMNKSEIKLLYKDAEIKPASKWYTSKSVLINKILDIDKKILKFTVEKIKNMSDYEFNKYYINILKLDVGNNLNYRTCVF